MINDFKAGTSKVKKTLKSSKLALLVFSYLVGILSNNDGDVLSIGYMSILSGFLLSGILSCGVLSGSGFHPVDQNRYFLFHAVAAAM